MSAWVSALLSLPALVGKLLDWFAGRQKQQERETIKQEASAAAAVEIEREELRQLKETMLAQDVAHTDLPDVRAASQRLRDGTF